MMSHFLVPSQFPAPVWGSHPGLRARQALFHQVLPSVLQGFPFVSSGFFQKVSGCGFLCFDPARACRPSHLCKPCLLLVLEVLNGCSSSVASSLSVCTVCLSPFLGGSYPCPCGRVFMVSHCSSPCFSLTPFVHFSPSL